jgi:acetolactate synthase-1/2/3 large subunit
VSYPDKARIKGHPGDLALAALAGFGVDVMFTLNGGHIWPMYDAARRRGVRIVDTRHEQTATWAAEAWAKLTRRPGLAVLTAGPGVTNGLSAITSAQFNGSPLVVIGGRAPMGTWGSGALQELDHVPLVAPVTKRAETIANGSHTYSVIQDLAGLAVAAHRGPVFADIPMDVFFAPTEAEITAPSNHTCIEADAAELSEAASLIAGASKPAIVAGSDVYWGEAGEDLRAVVEALRVPCFANGMGRGLLPPGHELLFSRTRGFLRKEADVVVVVGTPLDFRLGFGRFGSAQVVHLVDHPTGIALHHPEAISISGDLGSSLREIANHEGRRQDHEPWLQSLREAERAAAGSDRLLLEADGEPIKPTRVFGELRRRLHDDAVIICDGGDFASYAGKYLEPARPGCWLDTGPYGCLGNGPGYAIAARLARPSSQVVAILGDGAAGFSLMDVDTLVRNRLPVVMVVGNNGIWGLEKHPMNALYGWDEAADLQPDTRYDQIVSVLGGAGETVRSPADIGPALDRAFASGVPYLVNVMTDPRDSYPRSGSTGF